MINLRYLYNLPLQFTFFAIDSSDDDIEKFTGDFGRNMAAFVRRKKSRGDDVEEHHLIRRINEPVYKFRRWEDRPPYEMSCWGRMLVHPRTQDPTDRKGGVLFRTRLRGPFPLYKRLVEMARGNGWFSERNDAAG